MKIPDLFFLKKRAKHFYAGDVIVIEYSGENKPCDRSMAILVTPFTLTGRKGLTNIRTMFAIDMDTELFMDSDNVSGNVQAIFAKATPKMKAWFFEQLEKQRLKPDMEYLACIYNNNLTDAQKDEFLRLTGNQ